MKKRGTRICVLIFCIILCIIIACLAAFSGEPLVGTRRITDASKYGRYNDYVKSALKTAVSVLPEQIPSGADVIDYQYFYSRGLLGDPNYGILLKLHFSEEPAYSREKTRILELKDDDSYLVRAENEERLYFGNTKKWLEKLTDQEVLDGLCTRVVYAFFDEETLQIQYAAGQLWDGAEYDREIVEIGWNGLTDQAADGNS